MTSRLIHVITPGDHYSARTGSAIPTVVHGLSSVTPAHQPRPAVLVARGTYPDRYDSAEAVEYEQRRTRRTDRYLDLALSRLVARRPMKRADYAAALVAQREWDSAFVLLHNAPAGVAAVDVNRNVPILYAHNELLRTYTRREAGRALESAAAIVCVSSFLAEQTAGRLPPGLRDRVTVVRNGIDASFFRPSVGLPENSTRPLQVLFVGRVIPDKGAHVLAEAALRVPGIRITLVGSEGFSATAPPTAYESRLRQSIALLGERGRWLPFQPREVIAGMMRSADVVVVPSVWPDPFALTTLEGMASGAAVVASRIGGIPEAVCEAGLLVPPGDVAALASTLRELDRDREQLAAWKTTGRRHAEANDWAVAWHRLARTLGIVPS